MQTRRLGYDIKATFDHSIYSACGADLGQGKHSVQHGGMCAMCLVKGNVITYK